MTRILAFPVKGTRQVFECACGCQTWYLEPQGLVICADCGAVSSSIEVGKREEKHTG